MKCVLEIRDDFFKNIKNDYGDPPNIDFRLNRNLINKLMEISIDISLRRSESGPVPHGNHSLDKLIRESLGRRISMDLVLKIHGAAVGAGEGGKLQGFRLRQLAVGAGRSSSAFITAKIDSRSHLLRAVNSVNRITDGKSRVLGVAYAISFIHPFEDGNGRLMRALIPIAGTVGEKEEFAFWLFFSICTKLNIIKFIDALASLHDGFYDEYIYFYNRSIDSFNNLIEKLIFALKILMKK